MKPFMLNIGSYINRREIFSALFISILFLACNHTENKAVNSKEEVKNLDYPPEIIKNHLEKKYDNAVWLLYASNYHAGAKCECKHKPSINDTLIVSLDPELLWVKEMGDTIDIGLYFIIRKDTCACNIKQIDKFLNFGFLKKSDSIIYRQLSGVELDTDGKGGMVYLIDSVKAPIKLYKSPHNHKGTCEYFGREEGYYPVDEQDSLFRIYVREHKAQLAPTLMRICKQKGIF